MRAAFDARRRLAMALLDEIPALRYVRPQGAFYILIDVRGTGMDGGQFAGAALEEAHVALVPAASFGGGCARVCAHVLRRRRGGDPRGACAAEGLARRQEEGFACWINASAARASSMERGVPRM